MPKIKYLANDDGKKEFAMYIRVNAFATYHGLCNLADNADISRSTLKSRLDDPMSFRIDELAHIRKAIGGTKEDFLNYIGGLI